MKPRPFMRYKTAGGSEAEVYRTTGPNWTNSTNHDQAIGAILVPNHPALIPGWQATEWNANTGKGKHPLLDLVEELGPIFPLTAEGFAADYVSRINRKYAGKGLNYVAEGRFAVSEGVKVMKAVPCRCGRADCKGWYWGDPLGPDDQGEMLIYHASRHGSIDE